MKQNERALHERIEMRGMIDGWLRLFIVKLRNELKVKNIGQTGALSRSIAGQLRSNGNNVSEVLAKFSMYGRFIDMGVGRGVAANERQSNRENRAAASRYGANVNFVGRKPRRWLNKRKMAEIYRLRELLAEQMLGEMTADKMLGVLDEINVKM